MKHLKQIFQALLGYDSYDWYLLDTKGNVVSKK